MKTTINLFCGLMAIVLAACTNNEPEQVEPLENGQRVVSVKAYVPSAQTNSRLAITEQNSALTMEWTEGDAFSVTINGEQVFFTYDADEEVFTATLPEGAALEDGMEAEYPADNDGILEQSGKLDGSKTFMQGMYSVAENSFTFQHNTAILKASFNGLPDNATISSIRVGIGQSAINIDNPDLTEENIYINLRPVDQNQEMVFAAITADGDIYTATQTVQKTDGIVAGMFYEADNITLTKIPYVTFTAESEGQTLKYSGNNLQYSTDGVVWTPFTGCEFVPFGGATKLYLRGIDNLNGTATGYGNYSRISFSNNTIPVACTGDIRTLLDYKSYATVKTSDARFYSLFKDCTALTSAPALPATDLASYCYEDMFKDCTALTSAPALPATTLATSCYSNMFEGCTALTSAPVLPATTLANYCYYWMFRGCTSLTTAPALPATDLAVDCYNTMFKGCTKLEKAPVLPATILAKYCYCDMFNGCTSLNSVTMLATDIVARDCLTNWLKGVAATGTLYTDADMTETMRSHIPTGWSVESYSQP